MRSLVRCVGLLLLALGVASGALAGNWDRFRGPNGTGSVDDKNVPVTFGSKNHLLWKIALPGNGNSSPVVWDTSIFVHASSKDGKERMLLCLNTADGKERWRKTIPGAFVSIRQDSSLASSTPTTDGQAVYVSFWNGKEIILSAYSMAGEPLWSKNLGPFISQHGAGASPVLFKDKLILANDMDAYTESKGKGKQSKQPVPVAHPALLVALNKKTGEMLWETPRDAERACYSAPFFLEKKGQSQPDLIVVSTTAVTGYNPDDGSKRWEAKDWQAKNTRMRTVASSALADGVLVACSGDGAGDRLAIGLALPTDGKNDAPQSLWKTKDFPYVPCPLARGEHFYFVNDTGYAGCYEARSGKRVWRERLADSPFYASPLLIDGKVYAASENGDIYVFAAEPKYNLLAVNELGERVRATPAVADGRLYVRGDKHLLCIGKK